MHTSVALSRPRISTVYAIVVRYKHQLTAKPIHK